MTFIPIHSQHGATTAMRHALVEYMDKCTQIKIQRKNMHRMCNEILAKVLKITQLFANDTFHVHFYRRAPQTSFCIRIPLFVFLVSLPFFFVCVSAGWRYSIFIAHNTHAHSFSRRWSASNFPASNAIFQFSLCVLCACTMHLPKNALRLSPHSSNSLSSLAVNRAIEPSSRHCRPRVHA